MADAMKGVTKALTGMNGQLSLPEIQKTLREFERQNEKMDMTSEIMNDAMDDAFEEEGETEETEELVQQVFDEIGINLNTQLASVPATQVPQAQAQQHAQVLSPHLQAARRQVSPCPRDKLSKIT